MFDGQNQAMQRIGGAVAQLGETGADWAVKLQQADNYRKKSELDLALNDEWNGFQQTITPAADPAKLVPDWEKKMAAVVASKGKDMPPSMQAEVSHLVGQFKTQTTGQLGHLAQSMTIDKAKKAGTARLESAWDNFDEKGAEAIMQEMAGHGLIYAEDIPAMREKGVQRMQYQQAFQAINASPAKALDMLAETTDGGAPKNWKKLDPSQRYALQQSGRGALNTLRADTQNDLAERRFAGELIPEPELNLAVERGAVSAKWAESFRKQQLKDQAGGSADPSRFAEVLTQINSYDPVADGGRKHYAELFAEAQLLPEKMASDAIARLKDKSDPSNQLNSPVAKDGMGAIDDAFDKGLYGDFSKYEGYGENRKKVTVPAIYAKAIETKAKNQDALSSYLKAKPLATREDVIHFVAGLHADDVAREGAKLFADPAQRAVELPQADEVDAILQRHGYGSGSKK